MKKAGNTGSRADTSKTRAVYEATEIEEIRFEGVDVVTDSNDSEWDTDSHFGGTQNE